MLDKVFPATLRAYFKSLFYEATLAPSLVQLQSPSSSILPPETISDLRDTQLHLQNLFLEANTHEFSGIANRRFFVKAGKEELANIQEGLSQGAGLILIDVDRLHDVNRQLGREVADKLLSAVSQKLHETVTDLDPQKNDLAAHLGGDDFAVLITNTPSDTAEAIRTRIAKALTAVEIPLPDGRILPVRLQTGYARADSADDVGSLLHRADKDLIAQKQKRPALERGAPLDLRNG